MTRSKIITEPFDLIWLFAFHFTLECNSKIQFMTQCMHVCFYVLPNMGNEWKYSYMGNISQTHSAKQ